MARLTCILYIFCCVALNTHAQNIFTSTKNSLSLVYIDNGQADIRAGVRLNTDVRLHISSVLERLAAKSDHYFIYYQPNKLKPIYYTKINKRLDILDELNLDNEYAAPYYKFDNEYILNILNQEPIKITDSLLCYFYIKSDYIFKSLNKNPYEISRMFKYIPMELMALTGCNPGYTKVTIRVSYKEDKSMKMSKDKMQSELISLLQFYNNKEEKNYINYDIQVLD
jgi:hypothetical protein